MTNKRRKIGLYLMGGVLAFYLLVPVLVLFGSSVGALAPGLAHPLVWPALRLSLFTSLVSLLVIGVLGTPLAWLLSRASTPWARMLETALQLPVVVPPAVAGVALLLTFGRKGLLGTLLGGDAWSPTFTTGAVVMAEVFVSAPFFLQGAVAAFRQIDENLVVVARTLGASPVFILWRIGIPLASPGLITGAAMSWARGLGEFGATLMFAGNLEGRTQTMPLAIYTALETDLRVAQTLSVILIVFALLLLILTRVATQRLRRIP